LKRSGRSQRQQRAPTSREGAVPTKVTLFPSCAAWYSLGPEL
jgi:hypothetical protein